MNPTHHTSPDGEYLFDSDLIAQASLPFDAHKGYQFAPVSKGRGEAWFVTPADASSPTMVLRHYRRGGMIGKWVKDKYWWNGLKRTRAWREWQITAALHSEGFPVPRALAARVQRSGRFYRADLVTECIASVVPLSELLEQQDKPPEFWLALGRLVADFHCRGVWHADLNAHNILVQHASSEQEKLYIIDLDRAEFRENNAGWRDDNLARLRRSFDKLSRLSPSFNFAEENWASLQQGYYL